MGFKSIKIFFLLLLFASCDSSKKNSIAFNSERFSNDYEKNILFFDLSNDQKIVSGIQLINKNNEPNRKHLILPLSIENMDKNISLYNSFSNFNENTIIDYSIHNQPKALVGFVPKWSTSKDIKSNLFLVSSGLRRTFTYNHKKLSINNEALLSNDSIVYSGVFLPENSKAFEIDSTESDFLRPISEINEVRYYDVSNKGKIEIEYMVKASPSQKKYVDFFLKLAGILLIPFLQVVFIDKEITDVKKKNIRKIFIKTAIVLQIIIFLIIAYFIYAGYQNGEGVNILDLIILGIIALSEGYVLFIKKGSK